MSTAIRGCLRWIAAFSLVLAPVLAVAQWAPEGERRAQLELRAQAKLIAALDAELRGLAADGETLVRFGELQEMLATMKKLTGQGTLLRQDVREIEGEIRGYSGVNFAYRPTYLNWVRLVAVGELYPELVTVSGKTYRAVVVRRVTDVGLEVRHAEGSARLRPATLPAEFQDRFQWDAEEAEIMLKSEAEWEWLADRLAASRLIARLDSSAPIVTRSLDSSDPIEVRSLDSSGPIVTRRLDSSTGIIPSELDSSGRLGERH